MKTKSPVLWIVVIALCFFAFGYLTSLFVSKSSARRAPSYVERLDETLDLSDEQEKKIGDCLADEDEQIDAVIDRVRAPVVEEIETIRRTTSEKIRAILDESQRALFDGGGFSKDGDF